MNLKHKAKKRGFTLIEILISITILVILIIPLSSMILSSMKRNRQSEKLQEAAAEGQSYVEEFGAYDELELKKPSPSDIYYEFTDLDGNKFKLEKQADKYISKDLEEVKDNKGNVKYKAKFDLKKETDKLYKNKNNKEESSFTNYYATIKFDDNKISVNGPEEGADNKPDKTYVIDSISYTGNEINIWLDLDSSKHGIDKMVITDPSGNVLFNSSTDSLEPKNGYNHDVNRRIKILTDDYDRIYDLNVKIHCCGDLNLPADDKGLKNITADVYSGNYYYDENKKAKENKNVLVSCAYGKDSSGNEYETDVNVRQNKVEENTVIPSDLYTMTIYIYSKDAKDTDNPLFKGSLTHNVKVNEK